MNSFPRASFEEQIMSKDKYPSIFLHQMEAIAFIYWGNPKTLTPSLPGPWTTCGPVYGLPLRTPLQTTPKIKFKREKKVIRISLTSWSLASKFRALVMLGKCNRPEFSLGHNLYHWHSTLPFFLCCGYKYIWKTRKTPGSLKICVPLSAFPLPSCSAYSPAGSWTRPSLHNLPRGISNINTKWRRERNHKSIRLPGLSCKATAPKMAKM